MDVATTGLTVRRGTDQDDLLPFLGPYAQGHHLNPLEVWVAEDGRGVEGIVVMWDSGHSVIYLDNLCTRPDAPSDTGAQLILAVNVWCQEVGKTALCFVTPNLALAYLGQRRGAVVDGPMFRVRYDITTRVGASHDA